QPILPTALPTHLELAHRQATPFATLHKEPLPPPKSALAPSSPAVWSSPIPTTTACNPTNSKPPQPAVTPSTFLITLSIPPRREMPATSTALRTIWIRHVRKPSATTPSTASFRRKQPPPTPRAPLTA